MSNRTRALVAILALFLVAGFFFPAPMAHVSLPAEAIFSIGGFPVTNTMISAWLTMLILLVVGLKATRRMELVPRGAQNLVEGLVEAALGVAEAVAGKEWGRRFFPLAATIFLFILVSNWLGLFPGFGTVGVVHQDEHGQNLQQAAPGLYVLPFGAKAEEPKQAEKPAVKADEKAGTIHGRIDPIFRSANTDLNMTLALALVAMAFIEYWGISSLGLSGYVGKFINFRGPIDFYVGLLELVSEFAKIISFTFRLFGNIFAGEVLLAVIGFLVPWVAVLPFFGLELFVGFIQALVFAMLTLGFATIAVASHAEHEHKQPEPR